MGFKPFCSNRLESLLIETFSSEKYFQTRRPFVSIWTRRIFLKIKTEKHKWSRSNNVNIPLKGHDDKNRNTISASLENKHINVQAVTPCTPHGCVLDHAV